MKAMKAKLERMAKLEELVQELEATEADLRETNAMLQKDIEKRDQGLQEAVALICDLELKIETMETGKDEAWSTHGISLLSTDNLEEVQTPKSKCMIEVPDRSSSRKGTSSAKKRRSRILPAQHPRRQPSFLLNENESTSVLRSLYTTGANGSRALSIFSGYETEELDSPRLSALSECSDLDAYPDPIKLSEPEPTSTVSRSGPLPPFVTEKTGSEAYGDSKFLQIEDWIPHTPALPDDRIQAPSGNAIKDSQMTAKRQPTLGAAFEAKRTRNLKPEGPRNVSMFGGRLPPTPDTMSTSFKDRSVIEERSHYDRNNVYSSTTSVDYMASAGNVTTRPSTADTALFDGFDSWKQSDLRDDGGSDVECMLPSSYTRYASEPPQASASFSTEEELVAHEKHSLWTNQNHNIDQAHPRFLHSLRSRLSDSALSDLYLNRNASQSTMLSPLDWLEAAEATPDDLDDSPGNLWRSSTAEFAQDGEFQPPLVPTSRTRHNRSDQKYSQVRKGFASRLFGRSKTSTVHGPSSPGKNMPVSPRSVTDKRSSNTRRRSTKLDSNLKSPRRTAPRPISTYSAPEDPSVKNPRNYNSLENIKQPDDHQHRRRGSMSLLGWLKGSSNNNNNNDNIISPLSSSSPSAQKPISPITASPNTHINSGRCASQPPQRPNSSWGFSMRPTSRQSSRLNHNNLAINSSSTESVAALQHNNSHKRIRHPLAEEVQRSGP